MANRIRLVLLASIAGLGMVATGGPFGAQHAAWAQESGRGSHSDGDNRDDRRDRSRSRFGSGSDRGSDHGHGGRHDDDASSSSNNSSNNSSTKSTSGTSSSSASTTKPATESKTTSTSAASAASTRSWATSFVKEHDKNGNGYLDGDEVKDYKGKSEAITKDGVITVDSLVAAATTPSSSSTSTASSSTPTPATKTDADPSKRVLTGSASGKDGDKRRSYRFTSADDRLPSGLPDWFKAKDTNGDGQIEMSEYSRSWSKSTADAFNKLDLNGDGVITAKEAATK